MNRIAGEIESVNVRKSLSLVKIKVGKVRFSAMVVDTPETAPYLQVGQPIQVIFKETEVIMGKGTEHHISLQNKLPGTISTIDSGDLLSKVTLDTEAGPIVSVITTNAVQQLGLEPGVSATAMVKTNEVLLAEIWT